MLTTPYRCIVCDTHATYVITSPTDASAPTGTCYCGPCASSTSASMVPLDSPHAPSPDTVWVAMTRVYFDQVADCALFRIVSDGESPADAIESALGLVCPPDHMIPSTPGEDDERIVMYLIAARGTPIIADHVEALIADLAVSLMPL